MRRLPRSRHRKRPSFHCPPSLLYFLLLLAGLFFLTDLVVGLAVTFLAAFFSPNTVSQFFENSGVGAVRTMGPDIVILFLRESQFTAATLTAITQPF